MTSFLKSIMNFGLSRVSSSPGTHESQLRILIVLSMNGNNYYSSPFTEVLDKQGCRTYSNLL